MGLYKYMKTLKHLIYILNKDISHDNIKQMSKKERKTLKNKLLIEIDNL